MSYSLSYYSSFTSEMGAAEVLKAMELVKNPLSYLLSLNLTQTNKQKTRHNCSILSLFVFYIFTSSSAAENRNCLSPAEDIIYHKAQFLAFFLLMNIFLSLCQQLI